MFKSKIDKWLLICLILSIVACLLGASVALKMGGAVNYVFASIMLIIGAGFPFWLLISTRYIVNDTDLKIISGPFSWNIPVQSITSVREVENAITSPALSFDRLEISYGEDKIIHISPVDKTQFIQKLGNEKLIVTGKKLRAETTGKASRKSAKKNKREQQDFMKQRL